MAILINYFIYAALFSSDLGIQVKIVPDSYATV